MMALTKVILAYDGSEYSQKALEWLMNFAEQTTILTVIVKVLELPYDLESGMEAGVKSIRKGLKEQLEKVVFAFTEKGISAKAILLEGEAASQLIKYAKKERADLIICGTRGLGGFESLLLGSVAHKLVTYSPVPVLVIK
ncbi:MAG: universal stress protein [Negativicutes bacterium]|nr:universal stress protein [Negativicutes bacterium]